MQDQMICYEQLRPALVSAEASARGKKDIIWRRGGLEVKLGLDFAFNPSAELSRACTRRASGLVIWNLP
jgi:hypothetical protein